MILRRLGNKRKLAQKILQGVPKHNVYMEPFFGTGTLFWAKERAQYNFLNDKDDDVFNLWVVFRDRKEELLEAVEMAPYSMSLFKHWTKNKETDPIQKAVRFLYLSNYSYMGKSDTLHSTTVNSKKLLIENFLKCNIEFNRFLNSDFRDFFKQISVRDNDSVFCYCDPPYIGTADNYSYSFIEKDTIDLFQILTDKVKKYKKFYFTVSEFANPFILDLAKSHNLIVESLGERRTLKNRNEEILVSNFRRGSSLFGD